MINILSNKMLRHLFPFHNHIHLYVMNGIKLSNAYSVPHLPSYTKLYKCYM